MSKPDYEINIDWSWNNHDHPAQVRCYAYPVHLDPAEIINDPSKIILRGSKTGNECVVEAIRAVRAGNRDTGLSWLMASQCHDDNARRGIHDAGDSAIKYTMDTYGPQIP